MIASSFFRTARVASTPLLPLLSLLCAAQTCQAQSFTWTSPTSSNWSVGTNWQGGVAPATGGSDTTSLIFTNPNPTGYTATNDLGSPFTLNALTFAGRYGYGTGTSTTQVTVASATNNSLRFSGSFGASITLQSTANARVTPSVELAAPTTTISGPGSGNLFLTGSLTGTGQLIINRQGAAAAGQTILGGTANTFSGGVSLQSGIVGLDTVTGLGTGTLTIGGTNTSLRFNTFVSGAIVANNIAVPTAGNNFTYGGNNSAGFSGTISGAGGVSFAPAVGINLNLSGANTYTGATTVLASNTGSSAGTLNLQGANGSIRGTSGVTVGYFGALNLDNSTANNNDRLSDTAPVLLQRSTLGLTGNANASTSETMGALRGVGSSTVNLSAQTGQSTTLNAASLERVNRGAFVFAGAALGSAAPGTAGTSSLLFGNGAALTSSLVGGGGAAGTTNVSILPYAAGANTSGNTGNSLVTYDAANGVRPLNTATEYATTIADGTATTNNVRLTAPLAGLDGNTTINALVLDRTTTSPVTYGTVAGAGTLHVTSGTILATGSGSGNSIGVGTLDFGSREGVIITPPALTVSSNLTGTNGLTKAGNGVLTLSGNSSGLTGQITVGAGTVSVASVATNLGGTGDIALTGGTLLFTGTTPETTSRGLALGSDLGMVDANSGSTLTVAGTVSGTGALVKGSNAGTVVLTGNNTYTGGTFVRGGTLSFSSAANLGQTSNLVILPGGTLQNTGAATLNQPVTIAAGGGMRGIDNQADLTLNGSIGQNGTPTNVLDLTKTGPGALNLNGTSTFNGVLNVNAGLVRVNGALAQINTGGAGVVVAANAGLGGSGLIPRDVQLATTSFLAPGGSPANVGNLTIDGTLTAAGSFAMNLKVGTAGSADRVSVLGALAFNGGTLTLRLTDLTGNGTYAGPYAFLSADGGITGTLPTFVFDYTNAPGLADDGLRVVQNGNAFSVVPEPSANLLLALAFGVCGATVLLRRRRQAAV